LELVLEFKNKRMKTLVIVRHAKAEIIKKGQSDIDRKLTFKGKRDAAKVAKKLKKTAIVPDLFISSQAKRAMQTARIFAEKFDVKKKEIVINELLYSDIDLEALKTLLDTNAKDKSVVSIYGHNPTFQLLVSQLVNEFNEELNTSATVVIEFEVENWTDIIEKTGKLLHFIAKK